MKNKHSPNNNHLWRKTKSALASAASFVCALLVIAPLALVFLHLVRSGASAVNWSFFTELPKPVSKRSKKQWRGFASHSRKREQNRGDNSF